jgi:uncharacterized membrane protein HdeD (DUF308 family)
MDRPMYGQPDRPMAGQPAALRQVAQKLSKWWWVWLVTGTLWIIAALIVLQFRSASVVTVGVIIGVMFLVAGAQELLLASVAPSWKWLWILFGIVFLVAGVWALVNPIPTFVAVAEMLGFLFVLIGAFWIIEAFATRPMNDLWFLGLIAGIMLVVLGFWTGGQFVETKAALLLTFVGIWSLMHGIVDIIRAFRIRHISHLLTGAASGTSGPSTTGATGATGVA